MTDADKQELYRVVSGWLLTPGWPEQKHVRRCIQDAHDGKPDGTLITTDNMWMFRQYRNSVSPDPRQLVKEALDYAEDA